MPKSECPGNQNIDESNKKNILSTTGKDTFRNRVLDLFLKKESKKLIKNLNDNMGTLSTSISISCASDYISFYSFEGVQQILETLFNKDDIEIIKRLDDVPITIYFRLNKIPGFTIPLLTAQLTFFCNRGDCSVLNDVETRLDERTPNICGYLAEVDRIFLDSYSTFRDVVKGEHLINAQYYDEKSKDVRELLNLKTVKFWNKVFSKTPELIDNKTLYNLRSSELANNLVSLENRVFDK